MKTVQVPTQDVKTYLTKHRDALMTARRELLRLTANGGRCTIGDLAFVVARSTDYETSEWQATGILSHAIRNGAFGTWRAYPGAGLRRMDDAPVSKRRAA